MDGWMFIDDVHMHTPALVPRSPTPRPQAALNVKVGYHVNSGFGYPQFPQWLGKNSTTNKRCVT
jgi:hypothetical protein